MSSPSNDLLSLGGPFEVILADPPWNFTSNSRAKPGKNCRRHYDTMKLPEIKALPVPEVAARDALLVLWSTVPHLDQAMDLARAWGFKYVSELCWQKDRIGTGFWARNRHEPVLICKRGKFPCPKPAPFPDSVIEGQQREHSRKPDRLHEMIDEAWPTAAKLEMFARESRPGWTTWGSERTKFDRNPTSEDPELAALLGPDDDLEALLA